MSMRLTGNSSRLVFYLAKQHGTLVISTADIAGKEWCIYGDLQSCVTIRSGQQSVTVHIDTGVISKVRNARDLVEVEKESYHELMFRLDCLRKLKHSAKLQPVVTADSGNTYGWFVSVTLKTFSTSYTRSELLLMWKKHMEFMKAEPKESLIEKYLKLSADMSLFEGEFARLAVRYHRISDKERAKGKAKDAARRKAFREGSDRAKDMHPSLLPILETFVQWLMASDAPRLKRCNPWNIDAMKTFCEKHPIELTPMSRYIYNLLKATMMLHS